MVDSLTLRLTLGSATVRDRICDYVVVELQSCGYEDITPALLGFLGGLDCGTNYASAIARNLNVSRQRVARMVSELCQAGYLQQDAADGRQKAILFTQEGEELMAEVRRILARLDKAIEKETGRQGLNATVESLERIAAVLEQKL
ncbi:DNA-binding MarR family transcriptional regulator [Methylohalomonas lacus]|uniref:DNA-binding MarR family transcriptional regulator n=1 Tax=Methylohalomonas lacus TaxID=398773 RepID=A0AAE3HIW1_9GAMM|nr:winged helix DNA-binding protein [Methylohalomonas lacus]MCS3902660.1 DNA-binding MarR family transcriptional regulator [Methylohalomonas lacus]